MQLTQAQLTLWWRSWAAACRTQGWTREAGLSSAQIDAKRREIMAALGYRSLTEIDNAGFDRLLARVRTLADNLRGAIDEVRPSNTHARRLLWKIEWLTKCLALYLGGKDRAEAYVRSICADKFEWKDNLPRNYYALSAERAPGKEDSELDHLRITLTARLNGRTGLRAQAGDTVHDMCTKAGVLCACEPCKDARATARRARLAGPMKPAGKPSAPAPQPVAAGAPDDDGDPF